jgi:hypothetical protein
MIERGQSRLKKRYPTTLDHGTPWSAKEVESKEEEMEVDSSPSKMKKERKT